jgi:ABC-type lipoprotein export system ATPase subunit
MNAKTIVLITHNIDLMNYCDRIIQIQIQIQIQNHKLIDL